MPTSSQRRMKESLRRSTTKKKSGPRVYSGRSVKRTDVNRLSRSLKKKRTRDSRQTKVNPIEIKAPKTTSSRKKTVKRRPLSSYSSPTTPKKRSVSKRRVSISRKKSKKPSRHPTIFKANHGGGVKTGYPNRLFDRYMLQLNRHIDASQSAGSSVHMETPNRGGQPIIVQHHPSQEHPKEPEKQSKSLNSTLIEPVLKQSPPPETTPNEGSTIKRSAHAELIVRKANLSRLNAKSQSREFYMDRQTKKEKNSLAKQYRHIRENDSLSASISMNGSMTPSHEMPVSHHDQQTQRAIAAYQAKLRASDHKSKLGNKVAYHSSLKKSNHGFSGSTARRQKKNNSSVPSTAKQSKSIYSRPPSSITRRKKLSTPRRSLTKPSKKTNQSRSSLTKKKSTTKRVKHGSSIKSNRFRHQSKSKQSTKNHHRPSIPTNSVSINDLKVRALLGEGAFSKVYLGQWDLSKKNVHTNVPSHLQTQNVAIKVMRRKKKSGTSSKSKKGVRANELVAEQFILSRLNHPFLIKYHGSFFDKKRIYLLLEFSIGGEILAHWESSPLGYFPVNVARFYIGELVCALKYLHSHGFVYRDLKPENILLDREGHIKLVDFGFTKPLVDLKGEKNDESGWERNSVYRTYTLCGSKEYVAPEVLTDGGAHGHGFAVDFWSLGVLAYELMCGELPFDTQEASPFEVLDIIRETLMGDPSLNPGGIQRNWFGLPSASSSKQTGLEFPSFLSDRPTRDFIRELLVMDPSQRLGSKHGWLDVQRHPFFTSVQWNWKACNERMLKPPIQPEYANLDDVSNFETAKFDYQKNQTQSEGTILASAF